MQGRVGSRVWKEVYKSKLLVPAGLQIKSVIDVSPAYYTSMIGLSYDPISGLLTYQTDAGDMAVKKLDPVSYTLTDVGLLDVPGQALRNTCVFTYNGITYLMMPSSSNLYWAYYENDTLSELQSFALSQNYQYRIGWQKNSPYVVIASSNSSTSYPFVVIKVDGYTVSELGTVGSARYNTLLWENDDGVYFGCGNSSYDHGIYHVWVDGEEVINYETIGSSRDNHYSINSPYVVEYSGGNYYYRDLATGEVLDFELIKPSTWGFLLDRNTYIYNFSNVFYVQKPAEFDGTLYRLTGQPALIGLRLSESLSTPSSNEARVKFNDHTFMVSLYNTSQSIYRFYILQVLGDLEEYEIETIIKYNASPSVTARIGNRRYIEIPKKVVELMV